jgi:hypothetical protein
LWRGCRKTGPATCGPSTPSTITSSHMADALSDGILKQFPEKFRPTPVATSGVR